jgi:hypothetical protein
MRQKLPNPGVLGGGSLHEYRAALVYAVTDFVIDFTVTEDGVQPEFKEIVGKVHLIWDPRSHTR